MKKLILFIFLTLNILTAGGSRFGLTDLSLGNVITPFSAAGIGRSYEIAYEDSLLLNFRNFAIWNNISKTTLSLNINYDAIWAKNNLEESYSDNASFEGAFIGIPLIEKQMIFGLGLVPVTSINQRVITSSELDSSSVETNTLARGGLSRAIFNFVYKFSDKISVGLGYEYTFGNVRESAIISIFNNLGSKINYDYDYRVRGNGLILSAFSNYYPKLNIGLAIRPPVLGSITKVGNTVSNSINEEIKEDLVLPAEINFGLQYKFTNSYLVGMDFMYQDWKSGLKIDGNTVNQNSTFYHLGIGFERKGSERRFIDYLDQVDYRAGFFYKNLAQLYNNKEVSEIGFSLGFSLPVVLTRSRIDLAGYVSKRGELKNHSLEETTIGIKLSVSANEIWFVNLED